MLKDSGVLAGVLALCSWNIAASCSLSEQKGLKIDKVAKIIDYLVLQREEELCYRTKNSYVLFIVTITKNQSELSKQLLHLCVV